MNIGNVPETAPVVVDGVSIPFVMAWTTFMNRLKRAVNSIAPTNVLTATATLDFGNISNNAQADLTIAVAGAEANDSVALGLPAAPTSGINFSAFVSAADVVTVRARNDSGGAIDPASATYRVTVFNYS